MIHWLHNGACTPRLRLDDLVADGKPNEITNGMQVELSHDVCAMSFRSFVADAQYNSHLLGVLAFGKKLQHFALAGREDAGDTSVGVSWFEITRQHHLGHLGSEERFVP